MKIAMISEGREPIYGGGQIHVRCLCEGLVNNFGCKIDLFVRALKDNTGKKHNKNEHLLDGRRNVIRAGITSHFFSTFHRLLRMFQITRLLYWKTKKEKYDLIHGHALLPGLPIKIISLLTGVPCIYTVHGTMLLDANKKGLLPKLERFLTCGISYNLEISVSQKILDYHPKTKNLQIIYNGVDLTTIAAIPKLKKYTKHTFLTVARMDRQKNHQIILEVLNKLKSTISAEDIQFVWVGDGIEEENLKVKVEEYGLHDYIIFKGKLPYQETLQEFQKSHVFLLPSLGEGQPLTVLESFASGLPIIATDVGDNKEFVENNKNGLLITAGDKESLQEAILHYTTLGGNTLNEQSNYCIEHSKQYDWKNVVTKTFTCYKNTLSFIL